MYAFTFHRPQTVRQAAGLLTKESGRQALGRRSDAAADNEITARRPAADHRYVAD